ncbi:MAG: aminotransferase class V-fold PLP-dependent enzyme [Hyphomicrobiaceae bacterium TMED74]|nr:serine--glyoxylate aminotransferase [Filomicrobium sp.]RPG42306.1 MAG: aminotransferase class V-fold PLP-dependent enzyme [Hyphomicrobiaceae bacterium TMED74]
MSGSNEPRIAGRHFLQIPGPSPVPDRILKAMSMQVIDHRGPEFQKLGKRVLDGIKTIFKTKSPVIIYPASGTGAWEAALINTMSPGDKVLMYETGHFASLWKSMAEKIGIEPEFLESDWRSGVEANRIEERLRADTNHEIKAVCVVHNETSTGATSRIDEVRAAIDAAGHPALLMVDTISGLASADYRHDEWGVDVTVSGSQKGLMLPPGISFNAISEKALEVSKSAKLPKLFWSWEEMLPHNANGFFPYTPATNLLYGLDEAINMLHQEGLDSVFARHIRHGEAARKAVATWGLEILCQVERYHSPVLTGVVMPEGHDADNFRKLVLENFDMSLGTGLSKVAGKVFRIGHLGDINDLTLIGALAGVEMGLGLAGVPHSKGGVQAAMDHLAATAPSK